MDMNNQNPRYELLAKGIYVDPMVNSESLRETARMLRPQRTDFELVRIGSHHDGGYLLPNDFYGVTACFSPGVDNIASFESHLNSKGIPSHLADASVDAPPPGTPFKSFDKKFIGGFTTEKYITLEDWIKQKEPEAQEDSLILQMDIEGAEYEAILSTPMETLRKFRIMAIEFHLIETWGQRDFFRMVNLTFQKLLSEFTVVHSHPNNATGLVNMNGFNAPRVFELTLHKTSRVKVAGTATLPHPYDFPNIPGIPDLHFPDEWLRDQ
jgi:hypothetical protein